MLNSRSVVLVALAICYSAVGCAAFAVPPRVSFFSKTHALSRPLQQRSSLINSGGYPTSYARRARGVQGLSASIPSVSRTLSCCRYELCTAGFKQQIGGDGKKYQPLVELALPVVYTTPSLISVCAPFGNICGREMGWGG